MSPKYFLFICFYFIFKPFNFSQIRTDYTLKLDGADREYIVVKPSGIGPPGGYPVVFMFHGTSGDGEQFYNTSKWKEKGEIEKFITVFPSSLRYCILNFPDNNPVFFTRWNTGDLQADKCPNLQQNFKDDVRFVRQMVDTIKQKYSVNNKKIFAAGFSNGCSMIHKLAVEAPDVFSAVAGVASILQPLDSMKASKSIPIWNVIGTEDERFEYVFGISPLPFGGDSVLLYLNSYISRLQVCEGLTNSYSKVSTPNAVSYTYDTPVIPGNPGKFILTLIKGMDHIYPNGVNFPFAATDFFWDFFNQVSTSETKNLISASDDCKIYPNPSNDQMIIDVSSMPDIGRYDILVYNLLSQQVLVSRNNSEKQYILSKEMTGNGLFILQVKSNLKQMTRRIKFE